MHVLHVALNINTYTQNVLRVIVAPLCKHVPIWKWSTKIVVLNILIVWHNLWPHPIRVGGEGRAVLEFDTKGKADYQLHGTSYINYINAILGQAQDQSFDFPPTHPCMHVFLGKFFLC